jgi:hypothetical protein
VRTRGALVRITLAGTLVAGAVATVDSAQAGTAPLTAHGSSRRR